MSMDPIPIAPAAHYQCGGIAVDAEGRTSTLICGLSVRLHARVYMVRIGWRVIHCLRRRCSPRISRAFDIAESIRNDVNPRARKWSRHDARFVTSAADRQAHAQRIEALRMEVQDVMWAHVGIEDERTPYDGDEAHLEGIRDWIGGLIRQFGYCRPWFELASMSIVALELTRCALERTHSLGVHQRGDEKNTFVS